MDKHRCRLILAVCAIGLLQLLQPGLSHASGASDNVFKDDQVRNAVDAVESELEAWYSGGRSIKGDKSGGGTVRGASGNMMELLRNSDKLICSAWIIAFRQELQRLVTSDCLNPPLELIRAAEDLLRRVEKACMPVLDPDTAKASIPAPVSSAPETEKAKPVQGRPFVPRPGWTITDEICARQCEKESAAAQRADWNRHRAEENESKARDRLSAAERELNSDRENLTKAEARLQKTQANLKKLEAFYKKAGGVNRGRGSDSSLSSARGNARDAQQEVRTSRRRVELGEQKLSEARRAADSAKAARERADQEAERARKALEDCLRGCYKKARSATGGGSCMAPDSAGSSTVGTSSGTSAGTTPETASGTATGTPGGSSAETDTSTSGGFYSPSGE
ncbi:MAG: hypothetical protein R3E35_07760 [Rhodocyclaceae bacterium]